MKNGKQDKLISVQIPATNTLQKASAEVFDPGTLEEVYGDLTVGQTVLIPRMPGTVAKIIDVGEELGAARAVITSNKRTFTLLRNANRWYPELTYWSMVDTGAQQQKKRG